MNGMLWKCWKSNNIKPYDELNNESLSLTIMHSTA